MLPRFAPFAGATAVVLTVLGSMVALGQGDIVAEIRPTVINIKQSVPVLADIQIPTDDGFVQATVPITVDLSLQVSLSGPITISVEPIAPSIEVSEPTPQPMTGSQLIDALGIPYTVSMDGEGLEITEWTVFTVQQGDFSYAGETHVASDAVDIEDVVAVLRFFGQNQQLIDVEELYLGSWFEAGSRERFEGTTYLEPQVIGSYSIEITIVRPQPTPTPTPLPSGEDTGAASLDYAELARNTENHIGELIRFRGQVLQATEDYRGNSTLLRIRFAQYDSGDGVVAVWYNGDDRILENDTVDVVAFVDGRLTYTALLGQEVTIPELTARLVRVVTE